MKDLLDFLLAPARRTPWLVATAFGVVLALILVVGNVIPIAQPFGVALGVAACFAAGMIGASGGREFDQGIAAVLVAIVIANVIGAVASLATNPASALDLPLPGMVLLGLPAGTVGVCVAAWLTHRRRVA